MIRETLENGLQVVIRREERLPLVHVLLAVHAGALYDPPGREGLASLVVGLLDDGTRHRTEQEITFGVENLGTSLSLRTSTYLATVSFTALAEHLPPLLDILADIVQHPVFPEGRFVEERRRQAAGIQNQLADPSQVLNRQVIRKIYENTPLGHPVSGYVASVEAIRHEEVPAFHQRHYRPDRAILVIVGDVPEADTLRRIQDLLGPWSAPEPAPEPPAVDLHDRPRREGFLYPMKVNQVFVALGHLGPRRRDPAYNALRVFNYTFGGGAFASRLMQEVRVKRGYAYGAWSQITPGIFYPGLFLVRTETKVETAHDALALIQRLLEEVYEHGITPQELQDAQQYYQGAIPRMTETYGRLAQALLDQVLNDLPDEYWIRDVEEIQRLDVDTVNQAVARFLKPHQTTWVLVTDPGAFDPGRLDFLPVQQEEPR